MTLNSFDLQDSSITPLPSMNTLTSSPFLTLTLAKDFGFEELPFQHFIPNSAFYYTMLLGFFLFETFKEDVSAPVLPFKSLPTTFRRQLWGVAAKVVAHAEKPCSKSRQLQWSLCVSKNLGALPSRSAILLGMNRALPCEH